MRGLLKIAPIIISATLLLCAAEVRTPLRPMYTADIAITSDGEFLLANKGTSDVTLLDKDGKRLHNWSTEEPPTGVIVVEDKAYVTSSYDRGHLTCIDLNDNSIKYSTQTGMGACAPVVSPDRSKIYVLNRYKGTVSEVDATTGAVRREVKVLREPCDAVLSPDGRYLYVNNYLPAQRADVDYVAADVSIIDCNSFEKIKDVKLSNGSNALRGIAISPDGKYVFVSHNLGRFQVPTSQLQQDEYQCRKRDRHRHADAHRLDVDRRA